MVKVEADTPHSELTVDYEGDVAHVVKSEQHWLAVKVHLVNLFAEFFVFLLLFESMDLFRGNHFITCLYDWLEGHAYFLFQSWVNHSLKLVFSLDLLV